MELNKLENELLKLFKLGGLKEHSLNVAIKFPYMSNGYIVGLCHDLVEDDQISAEELGKILAKYGKDYLLKSILVVTRTKDTETYFEYIDRVINSGDDVSKDVKFVDLNNNFNKKETLRDDLAIRYEKAINKFGDRVIGGNSFSYNKV